MKKAPKVTKKFSSNPNNAFSLPLFFSIFVRLLLLLVKINFVKCSSETWVWNMQLKQHFENTRTKHFHFSERLSISQTLPIKPKLQFSCKSTVCLRNAPYLHSSALLCQAGERELCWAFHGVAGDIKVPMSSSHHEEGTVKWSSSRPGLYWRIKLA